MFQVTFDRTQVKNHCCGGTIQNNLMHLVFALGKFCFAFEFSRADKFATEGLVLSKLGS